MNSSPVLTSMANTPLLVSLVRVIRDARSATYDDHGSGTASFFFGGLRMNDSGPFDDAALAWHRLQYSPQLSSYVMGESGVGGCAPCATSLLGITGAVSCTLHLLVLVDGVVAERWTLDDYRGTTEAQSSSLPRDYEQLEQINSLTRILYSFLRMQRLYEVIMQRFTDSSRLAPVPFPPEFAEDVEAGFDATAALPVSAMGGGDLYAGRGVVDSPYGSAFLRTRSMGIAMRVLTGTEPLPPEDPACQRVWQWSVEGLVRIVLHSNRLWETQARAAREKLSGGSAASSPALRPESSPPQRLSGSLPHFGTPGNSLRPFQLPSASVWVGSGVAAKSTPSSLGSGALVRSGMACRVDAKKKEEEEEEEEGTQQQQQQQQRKRIELADREEATNAARCGIEVDNVVAAAAAVTFDYNSDNSLSVDAERDSSDSLLIEMMTQAWYMGMGLREASTAQRGGGSPVSLEEPRDSAEEVRELQTLVELCNTTRLEHLSELTRAEGKAQPQ